MSHLCCRPRSPQETKPRRLVTEISLADDFKRHGTLQIDVECLVSDPHRTATQLDWFPVLIRHQFVVLKSLRWLFRCCRLDRILGSRSPAGLNPTGKTPTEHTDWTEFHRSRKLTTATRAGALGLRFHGSDRPPEAIKASQRAWISSSACSGDNSALLGYFVCES